MGVGAAVEAGDATTSVTRPGDELGDLINANYFGRRIDSLEVLPGRHRCLTIPATEGGTMSTMSSGARQELVAAVAERYRQGTSAEKS